MIQQIELTAKKGENPLALEAGLRKFLEGKPGITIEAQPDGTVVATFVQEAFLLYAEELETSFKERLAIRRL